MTAAAQQIVDGTPGPVEHAAGEGTPIPLAEAEAFLYREARYLDDREFDKWLECYAPDSEFWMPAFPWRAIDYLNYNGSKVEGLYRVPGSGPQIKKWQRKFDEGKFHGASVIALQ